MAFAFSCRPEYPVASQDQIPQASKLTPVITVNQETNYVTFSIKETGVVPVWTFEETVENTSGVKQKKYVFAQNGIQLRLRDEGDHQVELKAYNAHGLSQGSQICTFHLDNTYRDPFDPEPFISKLSSQPWYWNYEKDNHFGCGPSVTSGEWEYENYGLKWWHAAAYEKDGFSLYDDCMTFTADGKYKYDPVDGKTYVNKDSGFKHEFKTGDEDYVVEIDAFESTYTVEQVWNGAGIEEVYLVLADGKNLSYIPNPEALTNPRYLIYGLTSKLADFVIDNGNISWRYQFAPKGKVPGLDYDAATNLWLPIDASEDTHEYGFYYAPGWAQIADPEVSHNGESYTISLPQATSDQWQAQFHIDPKEANAIAIDKGTTYAFSCLVKTNKDLPGMTFKLTDATSDSNFLFEERVAVPAGKEFLFERKNITMSEASAANMKMFFDFGGNEADTKVTIRRITVQEYTAPSSAINGVPFVGGQADLSFTKGEAVTVEGVDVTYIDPDFFEGDLASMKFAAETGDYRVLDLNGFLKVIPMSGSNPATYDNAKALWIIGEGIHKPADAAAPGWNEGFKTCLPFAKTGANTFKMTAFVDGPNYKIFGQAGWGMELSADKYDAVEGNGYFKVNGFGESVSSDSGNIWSGEAFEPGWYVIKVTDNGGTFSIVFDKKKEQYFDIEGATNLYRKATITPELWYSGGDWSGGLTPDYEIGANNDFTATIPAGVGGGEWMGQNKLHTGVATTNDKEYDFCCTLESNVDCVVTVKLTGNPEGDGDPHAFFYDGNVVLLAGEPLFYAKTNVKQRESNGDFTVIFDFGRVPVGKTVKATNICFQEHLEK